MLSVFCKMPIMPTDNMGNLRRQLMLRIVLSVFQFRVNKRCVRAMGTCARSVRDHLGGTSS